MDRTLFAKSGPDTERSYGQRSPASCLWLTHQHFRALHTRCVARCQGKAEWPSENIDKRADLRYPSAARDAKGNGSHPLWPIGAMESFDMAAVDLAGFRSAAFLGQCCPNTLPDAPTAPTVPAIVKRRRRPVFRTAIRTTVATLAYARWPRPLGGNQPAALQAGLRQVRLDPGQASSEN
jgi:hypothetical protein